MGTPVLKAQRRLDRVPAHLRGWMFRGLPVGMSDRKSRSDDRKSRSKRVWTQEDLDRGKAEGKRIHAFMRKNYPHLHEDDDWHCLYGADPRTTAWLIPAYVLSVLALTGLTLAVLTWLIRSVSAVLSG